MLRTNSKQAIENVGEFISCNTEMDPTEIYPEFLYETKYDKRRLSEQDRFIDWAQGLPAEGLFDYYLRRELPIQEISSDSDNPEVNELLKTWNAMIIVRDILEETDEEMLRYNMEKAERLLTIMIYNWVRKHSSVTKN